MVKKDKIGSETEVSHALDMTDQNMSVRHQVQQNVFSKYSRIQFSKTFYIARETVSFLIFRSFFFCSLPKSDIFCPFGPMALRLRVLVRTLSSDLGAELKVFGRKIPPKHNSKKYKVGTNFIHSELGYRGITSLKLLRNNIILGVVLYPWEARIFTGDDVAGFAYEKTYYQVLVDNRDADELPMELETLRISEDTTRNPSDVKVGFILLLEALWVLF